MDRAPPILSALAGGAPSVMVPRGTIVGIQLLRAVAAIGVVAHHASVVLFDNAGYNPAWSFRDVGSRGVELFFVLSGFIILYAHWSDPSGGAAAWRYAWNRLVRIIPPTFIVATGWLAVALIAGRIGFDVSSLGGIDLPLWLSSAFILPMLKQPSPIVIWSLRHELLFYGFFALRYISRPLALLAIVGWGLVSIAVMAEGGSQIVKTTFLNLNILFTFGIGAFFCCRLDGVQNFLASGQRLPAALLAVTFVAASYALRKTTSYENLTPLVFGLLAAALLLSVIPLRFGRVVDNIVRRSGDASFAIYLVHFPVITIGFKVLDKLQMPPAVSFAVLVTAGVATGFAFNRMIEAPLTRYLKGLGKRQQPVVMPIPASGQGDGIERLGM